MISKDSKKGTAMKYILELHDICYPDYFLGSNAIETYACPVYHGITNGDLVRSIRDEYMAGNNDILNGHEDGEALLDAALKEFIEPAIRDQSIESITGSDFSHCYENGSMYAYIGLFIEEDFRICSA